MDPTRESVAAPSSRPAVARALEEPPPAVRMRIPPAFEEVHSNGTVLHVGLPALPRGVAGRSLHSPTSQLNLSQFCHSHADATQRIPRKVLG